MAKRGYQLGSRAAIFYDEDTDLKVTPGQTVQIDLTKAGKRTMVAIQRGHLIEAAASSKSAEAEDTGNDKKKGGNKEQPK